MKILIAEDDFVSRTLLQEMLAPYGICHTVINGQEAVDAYRKQLESSDPYDLICLDIMMPQMDGQQALQEIRKIEKEKGIGGSDVTKIIMTTALSDPKNIMTAFIKGACEGYLTKPIEYEKINETMEKLGFTKQSPHES